MEKQGLKAVILGATGAIGRDLVQELVKSPNWAQVTVIVRKGLDEWEQLSSGEKQKLNILTTESLDNLNDVSKWDLTGYSSMFCCLGSLMKHGKETFFKVEQTYPLYGGKLASYYKVPHFALLSGEGVNSKSWNFYIRTKGQTEEKLKEMNFQHLSIFRPGFLLERRNDPKLIEKVAAFIPFVPKIQAKDLAKAFRLEAELIHSQGNQLNTILYKNSDVKYIADNSKFPENLKSL